MAIQLSDEIRGLINDSRTVKVLATVDGKETPHAVVAPTLTLDEKGYILYLETIESSQTNRNLVQSIWFGRRVSIALAGAGGATYVVRGVPLRAHVSGPVFQKHYTKFREQHGDVDLSSVWVIAPDSLSDESRAAQLREEEVKRPFFVHLDRLVKAQ